MTRTYVLLEVPDHVHELIKEKLMEADYDHAIIHQSRGKSGVTHLDMNGIALVKEGEGDD